MKKALFVTYFLFLITYSQSQNIVPNNSFENFTTCPTYPIQIYLAPPWFQPNFFNGINNSSSDLYNTCASAAWVGVPLNIEGYQNAKTGNGYSGICGSIDTNNVREYIEVPLLDTLIANRKYCVEFYVSLAGTSLYAISNMGAYFSVDSVIQTTSQFYALSNYTPQIENSSNNMLNDTTNWMLVSGNFIATGGEKYMTIGNFHTPATTNMQNAFGTMTDGAYYYIDDVSVVDCTNDGVNEVTENMNISVYPNPSEGVFEVKSRKEKIKSVAVFNMLGEEIKMQQVTGTSIIIDISKEAKGIYFIKVNTENGILNKKVVVQ